MKTLNLVEQVNEERITYSTSWVILSDGTRLRQHFDKHANHCLESGDGRITRWAKYEQFTCIDGMIGCTDSHTGNGERIMTAAEFCEMTGVTV